MLLKLITAPYRFRRHLKYHRDIIKHLRWSRMDAKRLDFYQAFIGPGERVFDIGANMGNRSKIFRAIGATVVAFEPQSHCAKFLEAAFRGDTSFTLVNAALSDQQGELTMHISEAHVLSTLDKEWMERMNQGGRFANQWVRTERVQVTTLDKAIEQFGLPSFIKIDVEGHEYSVIRGLNQAVQYVSLEFASESLDRTGQCIEHLDSLGHYEYQLSLGESMQFESDAWLNGHNIKSHMAALKQNDPLVWGDIYARLLG